MATSGAVRAGKAFVEIFAENNPLERGLKQAESKLKAFGGRVRNIGLGATQFGASIAAPFIAAGGFALKAAADFESAEVAFATMLGSAEAAKKVMEDLAKFGAETPFELPELQDATKKLLAFGIAQEDLIPTLRAVGDISSGIGAPIAEIAELYGKAKVQGRLFMEDINQLTGRGIPIIQELAKQFGVSESEVRGLVESGKIGFGNLETAFASMTGDGGQFAGMMEAQSKTLNGLFSTVLDTVGQVAREIGGVLIDDVKAFAATVIDLGNRTVEWISNNRELIATAVKIGAAIAAAGVAIATVGTVLIGAGFAIGAAGIAFGALASAVGFLLSPIGLVVAAVAAATYAFVKFTDTGRELSAIVVEAFGAIKDALARGDIKAAAAVLWSGLRLAWLEGTDAIRETWEGFTGELSKIFLGLDASIRSIWEKLTTWLQTSMFSAVEGTAGLVAGALEMVGRKQDALAVRGIALGANVAGGIIDGGLQGRLDKIDADTESAKELIDDGTAGKGAARLKELADARQAFADAVAAAKSADEVLVETELAEQEKKLGGDGSSPLRGKPVDALNTAAEVGTVAAAEAIAKALRPGGDPALSIAKASDKKLGNIDSGIEELNKKTVVLTPGKTR